MVYDFLGMLKLQMQEPTLALNKKLLNNYMYYSLISSSKCLSRLYCTCTQWKKSTPEAVVSCHSQSGNYLIADGFVTENGVQSYLSC
jgi:hypothetical protein